MKPQVLYIAGYGRSGSTLLDMILGEYDGVVSAGELRYIWDRGLQANWSCGCGEPFHGCSYWGSVMEHTLCRIDPGSIASLTDTIRPWSRALQAIQSQVLDGGASHQDARTVLRRHLEKLYRSIARTSGCDIIVDSSKWPDYAGLLAQIESLELHVIHLIRDPRAVAHSWSRRKKYEPQSTNGIYTPVYSTLRTALEWIVWNSAVQRQIRSMNLNAIRLRYEDFIGEPVETVDRVFRMLRNKRPTGSPFVDANTVRLRGNHAVSGNPVRFALGEVRLALDDEWRDAMPRRKQELVAMLTGPLMRKYGYAQKSNSTPWRRIIHKSNQKGKA